MRNIYSMLAVAACVSAVVAFVSEASAQSTANITLTGGITPGTCSVADISEAMPPVSADRLPSGNRGVPDSYTPFVIGLRSCAGVKSAKLTFGSSADAHPVTTDTFNNKDGGGPANISIWIQRQAACSGSGGGIRPGGTITLAINNASSFDYPVCAQYWRVNADPVVSGVVSTTFTLDISYE